MDKPPKSKAGPKEEAAPRPAKRPVRKSVLVTCPACGTRFKTPRGSRKSETPCLSCNEPVPIPSRKGSSDADGGSSKSPKPGEQKTDVFGAMAEERFGGEIYRPAFPFLDGTFSFPWYPEGLFRWIMLSLGCAITVLLFLVMHWCFSRGGFYARAGYALGFPFGWLSIWTYSYAASCASTIISETAAGNDRVEGWADPDWRDWFSDLLSLFPSVLAAIALAFGAGKLTEALGGPFWTPAGLALFFLLPICLLSTIDVNSPFVPFSPLIVKSLTTHGWAWLRFYAASLGLAIVWPGSFILGYQKEPFYAAVVTGPLMSLALLIYPRLLGRLAWCINGMED